MKAPISKRPSKFIQQLEQRKRALYQLTVAKTRTKRKVKTKTFHPTHLNEIREATDAEIELAELTEASPVDKYNSVYIIFWAIGVAFLLPYNAIISSVDYVKWRYPNTLVETDIAVTYTIVNICVLIVCLYLEVHKTEWWNRPLQRIRWGLCALMSVLIIVSLDLPFILYLTLTGLAAVFDAIVQCAIFSIAAQFPPRFTQAVVAGSGCSGLGVSLLRLATKSAFPTSHAGLRASSQLYFLLSGGLILLCLFLVFLLPHRPVFVFFDASEPEQGNGSTEFINRSKVQRVVSDSDPELNQPCTDGEVELCERGESAATRALVDAHDSGDVALNAQDGKLYIMSNVGGDSDEGDTEGLADSPTAVDPNDPHSEDGSHALAAEISGLLVEPRAVANHTLPLVDATRNALRAGVSPQTRRERFANTGGWGRSRASLGGVFARIRLASAAVFVNFFLTLSVFPVGESGVSLRGGGWEADLWASMCFLHAICESIDNNNNKHGDILVDIYICVSVYCTSVCMYARTLCNSCVCFACGVCMCAQTRVGTMHVGRARPVRGFSAPRPRRLVTLATDYTALKLMLSGPPVCVCVCVCVCVF